MKNWFGTLMSGMSFYPQLYPGYLMSEGKQDLGTLKIGVSTGWVLLFMCILALVLIYILFWRELRPHKRKRVDH